MRIIVVSGAYQAETFYQVEENIRLAKWASIKLWKENFAIFTPHLNTAHFEEYIKDQNIFLRGSLEIITRLIPGRDALYMLKNWKSSFGAKCEHRLAKRMGLKIFYEAENNKI